MEIEKRQGHNARELAQLVFPHARVKVYPDLSGHDRLLVIDFSTPITASRLVHLCSRSAWITAQEEGSYQTESLTTEGFIHLSHPDQILKVANAFYRDLPDPILLWINPNFQY